MYSLNVDPNKPHHYIISVCVKELHTKKNPGEFFLKYLPLYIHNNDLINLQNAVLLSEDKLFKTSQEDALRIYNCQKIVTDFILLRLSTIANKGSLHHFFTDHKLSDPEKFFEDFVKRSNKDKRIKDELISSTIKIFG